MLCATPAILVESESRSCSGQPGPGGELERSMSLVDLLERPSWYDVVARGGHPDETRGPSRRPGHTASNAAPGSLRSSVRAPPPLPS